MAFSVNYSCSSLMIETFGWKLEDNLVMAVYLLLRKMPSNRNWWHKCLLCICMKKQAPCPSTQWASNFFDIFVHYLWWKRWQRSESVISLEHHLHPSHFAQIILSWTNYIITSNITTFDAILLVTMPQLHQFFHFPDTLICTCNSSQSPP